MMGKTPKYVWLVEVSRDYGKNWEISSTLHTYQTREDARNECKKRNRGSWMKLTGYRYRVIRYLREGKIKNDRRQRRKERRHQTLSSV